jgi:hypothetical protein
LKSILFSFEKPVVMKLNYVVKALCVFVLFMNLSCESDDNINTNPDEGSENVPELSSENSILSFSLTKGSYSQNFNIENTTIEGQVESNIDLEGIQLFVEISEKASINPNPNTITSISEPFEFTVIAENGEEKTYTISIERKLSEENSILEFRIDTENFSTFASINEEDRTIIQRLPQYIDFTNLEIAIEISDRASLSRNSEDLVDFSSPVNLIVTSESGVEKEYTIELSPMTEDFSVTCDEMNVSKWFGGDDRNAPQYDIVPFDRNSGTGQIIRLDQDLSPSTFGVHLDRNFESAQSGSPFNASVELKLNIRTKDGDLLASTTTTVFPSFTGGFIDFDLSDLNLFLKSNTEYVFQWYLLDGAALGVNSGSNGTNTNGDASDFCFGGGYAGQSRVSQNTTLEDPEAWSTHGWNFNIRLEGKQ